MPTQAFSIRNNGGDYNTQSNNAYKFSDAVVKFALTQNTPFTVTIPTFATTVHASGASSTRLLAFFSFNKSANVFVKPDTSAVIAFPTGTATTDNIELNPDLNGGREVLMGQQLQLLTADTGVFVTIRLYSISNSI